MLDKWLATIVFLSINIVVFLYFVPKYKNTRPLYNIYKEYPFKEKPEIRAMIVPLYPHGYRLKIKVKNFSMSEICTIEEAKKPVGHIHIYINGKFFGMMFTSEDQPNLTPFLHKGENKITLMLQSPDHKIYLYNKKLISQTLYIDFNPENNAIHSDMINKSRPAALLKESNEIEMY